MSYKYLDHHSNQDIESSHKDLFSQLFTLPSKSNRFKISGTLD